MNNCHVVTGSPNAFHEFGNIPAPPGEGMRSPVPRVLRPPGPPSPVLLRGIHRPLLLKLRGNTGDATAGWENGGIGGLP